MTPASTAGDSAEPIAIVGIGCRFPGEANTAEEFWRLLLDGRQALGEIPAERWAGYAGEPRFAGSLRTVTTRGSYLADAAGFDAEFFGITPREAELMDPQQRMVLETSWEALEDAGIPARSLAGTDTGVYVGVGSDDYGRQLLEDLPRVEAWSGIGAAPCGVPNRVSHLLDLHGPSMAVDTACSSSLVAIHLACQSLRTGESGVALAGGVQLIAGPALTMVLDAAGATSPDGVCRTFDAAANGYGRGEGAGMLVLKRLADAVRDGDDVRAVLRGSAVGQDGHTNGIMAPNGDAQARVVRQALRQAGVDPGTVDYVEAHGTGTRAGDPVELRALASVYGRAAAAEACLIGSVKPNIGHLEAGAGVAGVIKTVLALRHGVIPPTVGVTTPNPDVDWAACGLRVTTRATPWPAARPVRRAGVSAFGYGGTVGHLVLESVPTPGPADIAAPPDDTDAGTARLFTVSSGTGPGVRAEAAALADWLAGAGARVPLRDLAHTLCAGRSHLTYRASAVADGHAGLIAELRCLADGQATPRTDTGQVPADAADAQVWVFSGHGSQWAGMGRELLRTEPAFREAIEKLEPAFLDEAGFSPVHAIRHDPLTDVAVIQPMIFAVQVGLDAALRSYGLRPAAVIGHSVGEIAAAVAAGVYPADAAARLVCRRSALLRRVAGQGAMALIGLPFEEVTALLADWPWVDAAVAASGESTVVSGSPAQVAAFGERCVAEGVLVRRVASDVAFHSTQMDPLTAELAAAAADLVPAAPTVPVYSTALADPRSAAPRDGTYWAANLRRPVRFAAAVQAAAADGYRVFVELAAHPVVTHSVSETLARYPGVLSTGTLRRDRPEQATLLAAIGTLHCRGALADPAALAPAGRRVPLPRRAWQHVAYWRAPSATGPALGVPDARTGTLLGESLCADGHSTTQVWRAHLNHASRPYPGTHPINGVEIVPAAVLLATFLAAGGTGALTDVRLAVPLTVTGEHAVQVVRAGATVRISSRTAGGEKDAASWVTHSVATLGARAANAPAVSTGAGPLTDAPADTVTARLRSTGVADTGFPWRVRSLARADGTAVATVLANSGAAALPALLDAAFSVAPLAIAEDSTLRMPATIRRVEWFAAEPPDTVTIRVDRTGADTVDILLGEPGGPVLGALRGVGFRTVDGDQDGPADPRRLAHRLHWPPVHLEADPRGRLRTVLLLGDPGVTAGLREQLVATGLRCLRAETPAELPELIDDLSHRDAVLVVPGTVGDGEAVHTAAERTAWLLAETAGTLVRECGSLPPRLWALTRGTADVAQAPVSGLTPVLAGEHPELRASSVDLDPGANIGDLVALLRAASEPDAFAIGPDGITAARLATLDGEQVAAPLHCRPDGTYLITGGLGALGTEVARWLVARGARRLVLAGRTPLPPRTDWDRITDPAPARRVAAVRSLEALGATVRVLAVDVADAAATAAALTPDALGLPPIAGVVHAAGVLDDRLLGELDEASLHRVFRPKVAGALVLDELFPPGSVDFFALFSSIGYHLGLPGQAGYGAANACLDALARRRAAAGDRGALSLGWTSWRDTGMARSEFVDREIAGRGVGAIGADEALRAWEYASGFGVPYTAVLRTVPGGNPPALLGDLATADPAHATDTGDSTDSMDTTGLDPAELREHLLREVCRQIEAELRIGADRLDVRRPLTELGLDSIMTQAIRRGLEQRLRLRLSATFIWNHPTAAAVAEHLATLLTGTGD